MDTLVTRAFSVAKRVRTETEIGANAVSVSLRRRGTGARDFRIAQGQEGPADRRWKNVRSRCPASDPLRRHQIFVTNRTQERADEMAEAIQRRRSLSTTHLSELPA